MSKILQKAQAIGADFAIVVFKGKTDKVDYIRFYKTGSWDLSRNCLLNYNEDRGRWDNSSELSFSNIINGMKWTGRKCSLIDFNKQERVNYE